MSDSRLSDGQPVVGADDTSAETVSNPVDKPAGYYVGVDLGGTSLFAAVVAPGSPEVLGQAKRKSKAQKGASSVTKRIARAVRDAVRRAGLEMPQIRGVGVGVPGPVEPEEGIVVSCTNLGETWDRYPLGERLSAELGGVPVALDNDVRSGAVAEHTYGAARGARDMIALFVGTGLGGGIVINNQLHSGFRHAAGEAGHTIILADGPLCGCGQRGHAEALANRTAIEQYIWSAIESGRRSVVPRILQDAGKRTITSGVIGDAYEAGDEVTIEAVQQAQYYLGLLVASCVNLLDPQAVVIGGGVVERMGDAYLERVREVARQHFLCRSRIDEVRIVPAALGDPSGAIGAALLASQRFG